MHMYEALVMGADGVIPSAANLVPQLCSDIYQAARNKQIDRAQQLQQQLNRVLQMYFTDRPSARSVPLLKTAMSLKGLCSPEVLPPMLKADKQEQDRVRRTLTELKIIQE